MKKNTYTIATLGSHSALQILKGARDEGFATLLISTKERAAFYRRFGFIDQMIEVPSFKQFPQIEQQVKKNNCILIPHGSFVAYLGEAGNKKLTVPYFGNKNVLTWEGDRQKQLQWFLKAGLLVPQLFRPKDRIDRSVIVKSYGAAGGKGYFVAHNNSDFAAKLRGFDSTQYIIQEYVVGVPMYFHFFYSPITKTVELLSIDRRYETNVDALGRMPLAHQETIEIVPSFVVVGNSPLCLRESLLPDVYQMAEKLIASSRQLIDERGIFGPFCLETIVTPDQKIYVIEVSCRIVAGTNLFIDGSPYASLYYDEPMSTGRRIAREIKHAIQQKKLQMVLD